MEGLKLWVIGGTLFFILGIQEQRIFLATIAGT